MDPNHSDLIQLLLDGELDSMYDAKLFGELSTNGDLRTELKHQLAIRNEVAHDRMALIPPASLTGAVFSGLGFTAPMAGAAAGAAGGFVATWLGRIGVPIAAAVLATSAMNFATTRDAMTRDAKTRDTERATLSRDAKMLEDNASTRSAIERDASARDENAIAHRAERASLALDARTIVREATTRDDLMRKENLITSDQNATTREENTRTRDENTRVVDENARTNNEDVALNVPVRSTLAEPAVSTLIVSNAIDVQRAEEPKTLQSMQLQNTRAAWDEYPAFTLQARGFSLKSMTETSVDPQTQWYQNLGLAMIYKLSDHHSVGVEFGSEVFPQVFNGTRQNGQIVQYEQQPSSMWAAAVYRYSFDGIGATSFRPMLQASFGGTKYGPLGRAMLGMSYSPVGPLSFILGIEGATMAYQYQQNWFTSSKIGLTYGMAVRF